MKAKEMFEKLGYEDFCGTLNYIKEYKDGREIFIDFDIKRKKISKGRCGFAIYKMDSRDIEITLKELQAINKQVEELGWLGSDKK